jgi:hypothetical protein
MKDVEDISSDGDGILVATVERTEDGISLLRIEVDRASNLSDGVDHVVS